jgi:hypothetical protein
MPLATTLRDRQLAILDRRIRLAWDQLLHARRAWAHSPNSATITNEQEAEQHLNQLLEQRHTLQLRRPSWSQR